MKHNNHETKYSHTTKNNKHKTVLTITDSIKGGNTELLQSKK